MRRKTLSILFLVALIAVNSVLALESTVTRSFSDNTPDQCSELTVSLTVDVIGVDSYYAIDEQVPSGWIISGPGTGDITEPGHIKWVVIISPVDTVYTYNVTVPCDASGINSFDGVYMFESNTEEQTILGETNVDVQEEMESKVVRGFSDSTPDQCSELTVTLDVYVNETDDYYAIDEEPPAGWTISDPGTGNTSEAGHIKWILIQGANDTIYQYKVLVPCDASGIYSFDGIYMFESDTEEQTILGETDVDAQQLIQTFDIELYGGWNLISLPLQPVNSSLEYVIKDLTGQIVVWYYNASSDEWTVYDTNAPFPWLNTLHNMDYGKAYWLKSTINQTLTVQGNTVKDYIIKLKPGWNFVGYNMSTSIMPNPISGLTTPIVLWAYHTAEDEWKVYDTEAPFPWLNTLTNMTSGKGYWLKSSIEQDWRI